mmetsp:Transcript_100731/g.307962  ORF Transcript_100731/g.307962 Transcript_100731/m.307962 type:complete len:229 (-) Transcript_100731:1702-2388(-)
MMPSLPRVSSGDHTDGVAAPSGRRPRKVSRGPSTPGSSASSAVMLATHVRLKTHSCSSRSWASTAGQSFSASSIRSPSAWYWLRPPTCSFAQPAAVSCRPRRAPATAWPAERSCERPAAWASRASCTKRSLFSQRASVAISAMRSNKLSTLSDMAFPRMIRYATGSGEPRFDEMSGEALTPPVARSTLRCSWTKSDFFVPISRRPRQKSDSSGSSRPGTPRRSKARST